MFLNDQCCNGRQDCFRIDLRAAMAHAADRSRRSGHNQTSWFADGVWVIREAPAEQKPKRSLWRRS